MKMSMQKDVWNDISVELEREYIYADYSLKIENPIEVNVSASSLGGHAHRVKTADGYAYYVAPGWKSIRWRVKDGSPLFKF